jgi:flagellar export protein FliJ
MKQVRATLSRYVRSVPSYQGRTFTAMEAVAMDNYILRLNRTLKELDEVRARKAVEVDRFRQVLIEARKARKVIEVLKERQWNRYLEDFRREEQLLLDDVTRNMGVNENRLTLEEPRLEERGFGGSELEEPVPQVRDGEEFSLEEM